jgi:hypothetical protein
MTDYTVEQLEEKIMNGETVSTVEFADAMRNADAASRIAQLTTERELETAKTHLAELETLKEQAGRDITPVERMRLGYKISDMEKKNADTNK